MVDAGDSAPDFTVPVAGGEAYNDIGQFTLSEALAEGPVVLAFVPAAFTSACTEELCAFRDGLARFVDLDAGGTVTFRQDYDTGDPDIDLAGIEAAVAAARSS